MSKYSYKDLLGKEKRTLIIQIQKKKIIYIFKMLLNLPKELMLHIITYFIPIDIDNMAIII